MAEKSAEKQAFTMGVRSVWYFNYIHGPNNAFTMFNIIQKRIYEATLTNWKKYQRLVRKPAMKYSDSVISSFYCSFLRTGEQLFWPWKLLCSQFVYL